MAKDGSDLHAEVLVLGSGPGGYTAAFRAADLGRKVVLVDRDRILGGVCLKIGCIPSKALLHVARVIDEAADLADHGVAFGEPKVDLDKLRDWKESVVARLTGGLETMAGKRGVEVVRGEGRLSGANEITVGGGQGETTIGFDAAILAAGSRVTRIGGVPWDDPRVMDSTGALELRDVPKRLLVVGGGIIGLEMANVYAALGSRLTIVEMLDGLVPGCDRDLVRPLQRRLEKRYGAAIHLETRVAEIKAQKNGLKASFEGDDPPRPQLFDRALVAVGRRPNGDRIGLEAVGLELDDGGFLPVDRQQRTAVPHIFAIGDLVPGPMLAHKASHQGKVAAEVAAGQKSGFDARVIPSVAYTDPEIAWVGLSETAAKAEGLSYEVGRFPWAASGRSLGMGRQEGLTKILFDPDSRRVIGAGVVGANAGDLIAELTLAIEMDCEAADLGLTIHPHPTLSETVAFAAEVFEGTITDLYLPRRKRR
jgi:dihydrolipoamide dehydrogenase